jgi:hypothetical protein
MNDIWEVDDQLGTNILEQVRTLNSNNDKTSSDMTKSQSIISEYITKQTELTEDKKAELIRKVCSITNKSHGVSNEDAILDEFCKLSGKTLQEMQGWVEIPLAEYGANNIISNVDSAGSVGGDIELEWVLIGKYDGITTDGELVEAKMRQKGLFKSMRDYENVQVQLYMHALGFQSGFLVEAFSKAPKKNASKSKTKCIAKEKSSANPNPNTNPNDKEIEIPTKTELIVYTHEVSYDSSYVNEIILARLAIFTKYFTGLMADTARKESILKSEPREWNKYLDEYIEIPQLDF